MKSHRCVTTWPRSRPTSTRSAATSTCSTPTATSGTYINAEPVRRRADATAADPDCDEPDRAPRGQDVPGGPATHRTGGRLAARRGLRHRADAAPGRYERARLPALDA